MSKPVTVLFTAVTEVEIDAPDCFEPDMEKIKAHLPDFYEFCVGAPPPAEWAVERVDILPDNAADLAP